MATNPSAFTSIAQDGWLPADNGLVAAAGDLDAFQSNTSGALTAGTLYLAKIMIRAAVTAHNVILPVSSAGVGASTGSFVGLYSSAGILLSGSADVGGSLTSAPSMQTLALTSAQSLAAGTFVWAAFVVNLATTQPGLYRNGGAGSLAIANAGLAAAALRFATNGTLLASLPASITPASNSTAGALPMWMGLS